MKHRAKSSKIKYEHDMIDGLRKFLEQIESWDEIKSIIPGEIHPTKSVARFTLSVQYETPTGVKCLAKSSSAVQEVFITTQNPTVFKQHLETFLHKTRVRTT